MYHITCNNALTFLQPRPGNWHRNQNRTTLGDTTNVTVDAPAEDAADAAEDAADAAGDAAENAGDAAEDAADAAVEPAPAN